MIVRGTKQAGERRGIEKKKAQEGRSLLEPA